MGSGLDNRLLFSLFYNGSSYVEGTRINGSTLHAISPDDKYVVLTHYDSSNSRTLTSSFEIDYINRKFIKNKDSYYNGSYAFYPNTVVDCRSLIFRSTTILARSSSGLYNRAFNFVTGAMYEIIFPSAFNDLTSQNCGLNLAGDILYRYTNTPVSTVTLHNVTMSGSTITISDAIASFKTPQSMGTPNNSAGVQLIPR